MGSNWIIPFEERGHSGSIFYNFIWNDNNIYIMDNHSMALWCWLKHLSKDKENNIFHIDAHYDTKNSYIEERAAAFSKLADKNATLEEYLNLSLGNPKLPIVILWDNYLSIFLKKYSKNINSAIFATHDNTTEDKPNLESNRVEYVKIFNLLWKLEDCLKKGKWIINVDLDYFFVDNNVGKILLVSDIFIEVLFEIIKKGLRDEKISVLTIAFSPDEDCSGGWENAELLCKKICNILDIDFKLQTK